MSKGIPSKVARSPTIIPQEDFNSGNIRFLYKLTYFYEIINPYIQL